MGVQAAKLFPSPARFAPASVRRRRSAGGGEAGRALVWQSSGIAAFAECSITLRLAGAAARPWTAAAEGALPLRAW